MVLLRGLGYIQTMRARLWILLGLLMAMRMAAAEGDMAEKLRRSVRLPTVNLEADFRFTKTDGMENQDASKPPKTLEELEAEEKALQARIVAEPSNPESYFKLGSICAGKIALVLARATNDVSSTVSLSEEQRKQVAAAREHLKEWTQWLDRAEAVAKDSPDLPVQRWGQRMMELYVSDIAEFGRVTERAARATFASSRMTDLIRFIGASRDPKQLATSIFMDLAAWGVANPKAASSPSKNGCF